MHITTTDISLLELSSSGLSSSYRTLVKVHTDDQIRLVICLSAWTEMTTLTRLSNCCSIDLEYSSRQQGSKKMFTKIAATDKGVEVMQCKKCKSEMSVNLADMIQWRESSWDRRSSFLYFWTSTIANPLDQVILQDQLQDILDALVDEIEIIRKRNLDS
jgi:hypothetical protein